MLATISFYPRCLNFTPLLWPFAGGKSTICRLALRLYDVDSGAVLVNGKDVRMVTQDSLRRNIGVVQQEPSLFNDTLRENIAFGCGDRDVSDAEIMAAARDAALGDFIDRLPEGLDTVVGELGKRLSGGERARVGIARALIKRPSLLIFDEPSMFRSLPCVRTVSSVDSMFLCLTSGTAFSYISLPLSDSSFFA